MILIIGGRYQGKLDYAKRRFGLSEGDIWVCEDEIRFSHRCLTYIDRYALRAVRAGTEPVSVFAEHPERWRDAVIIATDISSGIVPVEPELRAWREACGRMNNYLAEKADEVWRLFCGLPQRIK